MKFLWRQVANKGEIKGKSPSMSCINGDLVFSGRGRAATA